MPALIRRGIITDTRESRTTQREPGEYVISSDYFKNPDETIVDNEDADLFSLSKGQPTGYLSKWLEIDKEEEFRFKPFMSWRLPAQWTIVSDMNYYGEVIKSAYVIKGGSGSQWAQWKIPVEEAGQYELYYYLVRPDEIKYSNNRGGPRRSRRQSDNEYQFKVKYDGESYDAHLDVVRREDGWAMIGIYDFPADTVTVIVSDKTKLSKLTADAVKIVRR